MNINIAGQQARRYTVSVPVYEGPLDLLLQLIERAELDITSISLAHVTNQYLEYIQKMDEVAAEEISAFLVVAARLLQIKSEALLPRPVVREPGEEDPGETLAQQLRIYKRFKEIANWLQERDEHGLRTYLRIAPPPRVESRLDLSEITLDDLMLVILELSSRELEKKSLGTVITAPRVTIREKISLITRTLSQFKSTTFGDLLGKQPSRLEVVVTFLALLELVKRYHVAARQSSLFTPIEIERLEEWSEDEEFEIEFE